MSTIHKAKEVLKALCEVHVPINPSTPKPLNIELNTYDIAAICEAAVEAGKVLKFSTEYPLSKEARAKWKAWIKRYG